VTWNATNRAGVEVPDGTYKLRMELADRNSTSAAQNNQGTFTFTKTAAGFTQTSSNGGFTGVTVTYAAAPTASCDNGVVEVGETCDPPGSCPSSCAASADACMPAVLVGSAATCSAACEVQAITDCGAVDGCCPTGCSAANDGDCASDDSSLSGGCATGSSGAGALALLLGVGLLLGKPRRRAA
jgi:MYXO-CTERM domain-containing protein